MKKSTNLKIDILVIVIICAIGLALVWPKFLGSNGGMITGNRVKIKGLEKVAELYANEHDNKFL